MAGGKTFKVFFDADISGLAKGTDDAAGHLGKLDGGMGKLGTVGKGLSLALGGIGLAAGAGMISSIGVAADFEHGLSQVAAVSGATAKEMDGLHDAALRIGKDTSFSATEAASAMEELAAQGVSAGDIINGAADATVNLAAAGGTDLVTAATAAASAMSIWHLKTSDMNEVVNRLTGAANVSSFGVADMTQAMAAGGIAAATFGVSMQDTTTTLAALAKGGFQSGSDAGTSFKTMIASLAAPTGAGAKEIGALGLNFRDATGHLKDMPAILDELHGKLDKLSPAQRDMALSTIFGSDAMRAAGAMMQLTSKDFKEMSDSMGKTDAAAIAKTRMDNYKGSLDGLKGTIETIQIQIGEKLLPVLSAGAKWLSDLLPKAFDAVGAAIGPVAETVGGLVDYFQAFLETGDSMNDYLSNLPGWLQPIAENAAIVERAIASVVDVFMGIDGAAAALAIGLVAAGLIALGIAAWGAAAGMIAAALPIIGIVAAVALVAAGIALLVMKWDVITAKVPILGTAFDAVAAGLKSFGVWITTNFIPMVTKIYEATAAQVGKAIAWVKEHWEEIKQPFVGFATFIEERVIPVYKKIFETEIEWLGKAIAWVKEHWDEIRAVIEPAVKALIIILETNFKLMANAFETAFGVIEGLVDVFMGIFTGDWDRLKKGVLEIVFALKDGAVQAVKDLISGVTALVPELLAAGAALGGALLDGLKSAFGAVVGIAGDLAEILTSALKGVINSEVIARINSIWIGMPDWLGGGGWGPHIQPLASGTRDFIGGMALVGEQGPELVRLPRGADVFSNADSQAMLSAPGRGAGGRGDLIVNQHIYGDWKASTPVEASIYLGDMVHMFARALNRIGYPA